VNKASMLQVPAWCWNQCTKAAIQSWKTYFFGWKM